MDVKRIVVTGAAGQIGYSILPMIAKGEALGLNQKIILVLFDLPKCEKKMNGIALELEDIISPILVKIEIEVTPERAFKDADIIICFAGLMELGLEFCRFDLFSVNKGIYEEHGKAINLYAKKSCKVFVVSNPCNTLTLVLMKNTPSISPKNFIAVTYLDQNRAKSLIARHLNIIPSDVHGVIVWGNHSFTMVPDYSHCLIKKDSKFHKADELLTDPEFNEKFLSDVRNRGLQICECMTRTCSFSVATATVNLIHEFFIGTHINEFTSMGVYSEGTYNVEKGIYFGMPCICKNGDYIIAKDLILSDKIKEMLKVSAEELKEEKRLANL